MENKRKMRARKSRAVIWFITLAMLAGGIGLYTLTREREPSYQGKSLRTWLSQTGTTRIFPVGDDPVELAVRQMGTNAIPSLLEMLKRKSDSPFATKILDLSERFHALRYIFAPKQAWQENELAVKGFYCLGTVASNAAPELIRIYHENISDSSRSCALESFCYVSPASSKDLLSDALTNTNGNLRYVALQLIPTNQPDFAVPHLIKMLGDESADIQGQAAFKLIKFGTNSLPAVPELVKLACSAPTNYLSELGAWNAAAIALGKLDPQTAAKVLTNAYWANKKDED